MSHTKSTIMGHTVPGIDRLDALYMAEYVARIQMDEATTDESFSHWHNLSVELLKSIEVLECEVWGNK